MAKKVYAGVVGLVVVAAVVVWATWRPANNANFPQGTLWICTDPKCGHSFTLTMKELGEFYKQHYGEKPKCPKSGHVAVRAEKCVYCGKVFPQAQGAQVCPYCGKPQPPPAD